MYVVLAKIEVVKGIYGPFITKDSAVAEKKERQKNSKMRYVVRNVEAPLSEVTEEMETLWKDE